MIGVVMDVIVGCLDRIIFVRVGWRLLAGIGTIGGRACTTTILTVRTLVVAFVPRWKLTNKDFGLWTLFWSLVLGLKNR